MNSTIIFAMMLIVDFLTFIPSVFLMLISGFVFDDPRRGIHACLKWIVFFLFTLPFFIIGNGLLVGMALWRSYVLTAALWGSFLPVIVVFGFVARLYYFEEFKKRLLDWRSARSYAKLTAFPEMAEFRTLTNTLPASLRNNLAIRAQKERIEKGVKPPATIDELYARQYCVMKNLKNAFKEGSISIETYVVQHSAYLLECHVLWKEFGEVTDYPKEKFRAI
ncbi:hypothetical protein [Acetobacter nitrogenifigens]|nr:hypothetical protein [Acetobacter nitrogenifigens]